jgi:indoleamine 2,3-dioxygenase
MPMQRSYTDGFFDIGGNHGFLPCSLPMERLSGVYAPVQDILDRMPVMLPDGSQGLLHHPDAIAGAIDLLPDLSTSVEAEHDIFMVQALFRGYGFLLSAYTLEPAYQHFRATGAYGKARTVVPVQVARPFVTAARKLDVHPWLDYHYAYSLGNFRKKNPAGGLTWENLDMCVRFSGQPDEVGFIMLHVDINQFSPALVGSVMDTLEAVGKDDTAAVNAAIARNHATLKSMNERRKQMWKASRWTHYNDFRVFIMGVKGNEEIFGDGIVYSGVWEEPHQYRGQTGAQDDIIPMEDIFSGVTAFYPRNELTKYLYDLRTYRPKCVQHFFTDLGETVDQWGELGLAGQLFDTGRSEALCHLLGILEEIYHFRNGHWQFVQKYIMSNTPYAKATGGTPITSWLPNQLKAVMSQMDRVIGYVDTIGEPADAAALSILRHNKATLAQKRQLLDEQLAMVERGRFSPDAVFDLNEKYNLRDQPE